MKYEFKKYVNSFTPGWFLITVLSFGAIVAAVAVLVMDEEDALIITISLGGVGLIMLLIGLMQFFSTRRLFKKIETEGLAERLEEEFRQAVPMADGKVRMGSQHVFIKGGSKIPEYAEIRKIYQYVHKTNYVEDRRELRYEDPAGKVVTLCRLQTRGRSDNEMIQIIAFIQTKNPGIKIGYHS